MEILQAKKKLYQIGMHTYIDEIIKNTRHDNNWDKINIVYRKIYSFKYLYF